MHEKTVLDPENMDYIKNFLSNYLFGTEYYDAPDEIPVITYSNDSEIISVERNYPNRSDWVKNPLILYINFKNYPDDPPDTNFRTYNLMIEATSREIHEFADKFGCECIVTNVLDYYNYRKTVLSRTMLISMITCIIAAVLNLTIIISTVQMEFQINAVSHTIQKVIGNTLISRLKILCISLFAADLISAVTSCVISRLAGIGNVALIVFLNILFVCFEFLIINIFAQIEDKRQIQRILKGGL